MAGLDISEKAGQMTGDSGGRIPLHRRIAVLLLVVATGLLTLVAVVAGYLRAQVLDTDRYVDTVAPLAADPAIQSAVAETLTDAVLARIDVEGAAADLGRAISAPDERNPLVALTLRNLPSVLGAYTEDLIADAASTLVHSDAFPRLWTAANRQAHRGAVAALTGVEGGVVRTDTPGVIAISLDPLLAEIGDELDSRGFVLPEREFALGTEFVIVESAELARAQRAVRILDRGAIALALAALACAAGAILVAGTGFRRYTVIALGACVMVAMAVLALSLWVVLPVYLEQVSARDGVARAVYDTLLHPLRVDAGVTASVGALAVVVALLAGPSRPATRLRATGRRMFDRLRRPAPG
ncbi:hypothetical protein [Nocardia neocaledoniensis]|uniref:hypothetical protein n=1 Tax=Nocardia neocaledoniensis TaxID=236511 RepID=UPI002453CFF7|nr:hypothetical protein [Nocardia neocaledoniensis]